MGNVNIRRGMPPRKLDRTTFRNRFLSRFDDPAFQILRNELCAIEAVAWEAYGAGRKAPVTRPAGPGFADPTYELAVDWLQARDAIAQAQAPGQVCSVRDEPLISSTRNAARALCEAVSAQRSGKLVAGGQGLREPRPK